MMPRRALIFLLFFLSGAAGLGHQMAWIKMFTAGLGHEMPALLAVVTALFGGLAAGGWLFDRRLGAALRPGRWWGALELIIGAWSIALTWLIPSINTLALQWIGLDASPLRQGAIAFAVPFLALLPATLAMGATLPAMDRWLAPLTPDGRCLGSVYALNTFGAVAGALGGVFVLMPSLGLRGSALVFGAVNVLCGLAALAQSVSARFAPPISSAARTDAISPRRLTLTLCGTGLLGMGFEVVGVRVLAQVLEGTIYTYAAVLSIFLLGTALGAALDQKFGRAAPVRPLLASLLGALATGVMAGIGFLHQAPGSYDWCRAHWGDTPLAVMGSEMFVALTVFGPATIAMGAAFSHLAQAARRPDGGVGRAVAWNTAGGALAGGVFGVLLLPALGAKWTLVLIAFGYLLFLPRLAGRHWLGVALPVVLLLALPPHLRLVTLPPGATLLDYRDGVLASVAVVQERGGERVLRVNTRFQMGGTAAALAERRQAFIPLLLHANPRHALFLGPGTGITLGAAARFPGLEIDGVELVPEVLEAMRFFTGWNFDPACQPNVRLRAADARRQIRATRERYDVVVADLFHPAQDGAGFLYTREHFQAVRDRLQPGGLFCQWLPLHQLDEPTLRIILRTFTDTFPETRAFLLHFNADIPVLGLVGTLEPLRLPADWLERRALDDKFREQLRGVGLERSLHLFGCLAGGPEALRRYAGDALPGTDNFPRVSFTAPRGTARRDTPPWTLLQTFLEQCPAQPNDLLAMPGDEIFQKHLADYLAARNGYLRGLMEEGNGALAAAIDLYLASARQSLYFTPAYARCVTLVQMLAQTDPAAARTLFARLEAAQPAQPLGRKLLGPLFEKAP